MTSEGSPPATLTVLHRPSGNARRGPGSRQHVGMSTFELSGTLRRIRRLADVSQRELALACGISQTAVAAAETGRRDLPVSTLAVAAELAGLRLTLVDGDGTEVPPMSSNGVRDLGAKRFPAHLDTRHADEGAWLYEPRRDRPEASFTVTRSRAIRDSGRRRNGTPQDHHEPRPGDSPHERKAQRQREARRRAEQERQRRADSAAWRPWTGFACSCPSDCDNVDLGERPLHADGCRCLCDLG
jgi:transcriptional regulator with XRE-family HTH domain